MATGRSRRSSRSPTRSQESGTESENEDDLGAHGSDNLHANLLGILAHPDLIKQGRLQNLPKGLGVLFITSSDDRVFCAGADLNQILDGSLSGDRFQSVTNTIAALPIPSIAALSGNVFGGGAELAWRKSSGMSPMG